MTKKWKPISIAHGSPLLSHIFFADDIILFAEASFDQILVVRDCLDCFCAWLGQTINFEKSSLMFSSNVPQSTADDIIGLAGIPHTKDIGVYLGLPMINGRVSKNSFGYLLDKLHKKLAGWKADTLPFAGRVTLAKHVLNTLPFYSMQVMRLPVALCDEMNRICRSFIWGHKPNERKAYLIGWDTICQPKEVGSLGLRNMRALNQAALVKLAWRFVKIRTHFGCKFSSQNMVMVGLALMCLKLVVIHPTYGEAL